MGLQTSAQKKWSGQTRHLQQHLGLPEAIVLGISSTVGGTIFVLVGLAIGEAGLGVLFSFALALIATIVVALPYTELAYCYPQAGGIYTFVQQTFGDQWGFISLSSYLGVAAYMGIGFGNYLHALLPLPSLVGSLLLFIALTLFNVYDVHLVDRLLTLIVLLTLMSLLALSLGGLLSLHSHVLLPVLPHGFGGIMNATPLAFLALSGFDVLAAAGEEVDRPQRTLPLAIFLTLAIVFSLYVLICIVLVSLLPASVLATSPAPLAAAASLVFGEPGRLLMICATLLANAARSNAVLVASSRVTFAMARDGLFPRFLARLSSGGMPYAAMLFDGILFLLMVLFVSVTWAALLANTLYVLQFFFAFATLLILRRQRRKLPVFRTPAFPVILPLAVASCLCLLLAGGRGAVEIACVWPGSGWLLAVLMRKIATWQTHGLQPS